MDLTSLCPDDQRRSPSALTESQTEDLDSASMLQSPTVNLFSAHEPRTETVFDLVDTSDKSTDSDSVKSLTPHCLSLCSEPLPKDDDFRVRCCLDSSEPTLPLLPQTSHDLISPQSDAFEFYVQQEPSRSFTESFCTVSSTSEGLMDASITELLSSSSSSSEHSEAMSLLRSLTPQSDSLGSDKVEEPMPDLYIFESDTQDFFLSPNVDPHEIKCPEYQPLPQTGGEKANQECDTHASMCDSGDILTQCHRGSGEECATENHESDVSQHAGLTAPAADAWEVDLMSVNDVRQGKAEVAGLTLPLQSRESPVELWLDACQYLAGEDTEEQDVLDGTGPSVMQGGSSATSDLSFPPGGSDYSHDASEGIGWSSDDTRGWGPPVERWSSVDSWASALSDWTGIIAAPPEDITAAFAEIGAEIDALTQALAEVNTHIEAETSKEGQSLEIAAQAQSQPTMGVQDQPLKAQNIPESSIHSGQSCLSLCLEATGPELCDRETYHSVESLCDSTPSTQGEREREEFLSCQAEGSPCPPPHHSSMGSLGATVAAPPGHSVDASAVTLMPGSTPSADLDFSQFGRYVKSLEMDIFMSNEEEPITLNITEDTDLDAPAELVIEEPLGDELCKVTDECSASAAKQEAKRRFGRAEVEGNKPTTDHNFLSTHTLTNSHVPGVDTQPGRHINVHTHVSFDSLPDLDGACQVEPQWGSPKFIMPLAPLCFGSSLVCRTSSSLEGDQHCDKRSLNDNRDLSCDHVQHRALWPTPDGITDKPSLEGDEELIHKKENTLNAAEKSSPEGLLDFTSDTAEHAARKSITEEIDDRSREQENFPVFPFEPFVISEEKRIAYITLDINDPFVSRVAKPITQPQLSQRTPEKMPHKTRSKKDKSAGHHHGAPGSKKQEVISHHVPNQQACKQQETHPPAGENHTSENTIAGLEANEAKLVIETVVATEKSASKSHGHKKKKKHGQNATSVASGGEPLAEVENGAKPKTAKGRIDMFESKLGAKAGKAQMDSIQSDGAEKKSQQPEAKASQGEQCQNHTDHKDHQPKNFPSPLNDDVIKRRRLSENKFGKLVSVLESKFPKSDVSVKAKGAKGEELKADVGASRKKAYSEVVKQKVPHKEDPKVVQPIQAASVSGDPQSLSLWCQFAAVFSDYTVTWSREGAVLAEIKRSAGDESRVSLTITNASNKHLGKYQCRLSSLHGSVTLDYLLTYEVLSEIVIPPTPKTITVAPVEVSSEEEDVRCSRLMFKEDFLSDQYFGDNHPISIITEKVHFGEGMHRRAFRTKLHLGQMPLLLPGHPCVLKVHNAISYGTKNNDELVQKNFTLAVEECQVQNTAREYIKGYTAAAQSFEAFGDVPEIIPIYLVHRPSNDIPYATLEEELIGDFVKYSVKDGKEINLMRRDSEAGQKCCAFQHWVYHTTEGNLLVTDMQGVGMRLTDVGIATCKKGYKGFKGNCATTFIDQFKALHQCNKYCEILGLVSLQPKPKKPASVPKPKPQPSAAPKKKTFGPTVKGKS
ncbi:alpha-protein kinase 2 [Stegastes partitus]|uniref:non-specific serine/threonine protein kinase n=1 Tax=Stegastes partitus TaxID=144197 RepID=A0A3B5AHA7_9TELE|nr:PREDICTED: alpha-protein kinase 2 [Stegastes partitus]